ncbi:MAG TPA: hypothetical protein DIW44_07910 [Anaerolineaceae bacterium]|nr:hypothetical protein [Anaerolineaceae bacterium]
MFVGGEFYEDLAWVTDTPAPPVVDALFLNGGRACLNVIAKYLHAKNINQILLPSYLCPSILDVLDQHAISYSFYTIKEDLSIDLDDLLEKSKNHQVLYFINYFGFHHSFEALKILNQLQAAGMLLIEDNAQAGFTTSSIGDFCFNSLRKVCAVDGGYLATRNLNLDYLLPVFDHPNNRLPIIRNYRSLLRTYLFEGRGKLEDLDQLFYLAEQFYEQDGVILGDADEQKMIERLDWQAIKAIRRNNYAYLLGQIVDLPRLNPIFPTLQAEIMPMGLPVYISGISRDLLTAQLAEESISLTVHWDALLSDPRTKSNPKVTSIAEKILTLPVDQYTNKSQLDYLVNNLRKATY